MRYVAYFWPSTSIYCVNGSDVLVKNSINQWWDFYFIEIQELLRINSTHIRALFAIRSRIKRHPRDLWAFLHFGRVHSTEEAKHKREYDHHGFICASQIHPVHWNRESQSKITCVLLEVIYSIKHNYGYKLLTWPLTHWGRDKIAAISQTTFASAFSWKYKFRLRFHLN